MRIGRAHGAIQSRKKNYDVIVIGGGDHGLATAYYLARIHGITSVAVIEKGYLGGGNTGGDTAINCSNYVSDEAAQLNEMALKLWQGLNQELNFNVMFSQRGVFHLGHNLQDMRDIQRRVNVDQLNGIDGEVLTTAQLQERVPLLNCSPKSRYPVLGACFQPRAGIARHDTVAWGYARAAEALGVDLIQHTEVTGIRCEHGVAVGVNTTHGYIGAGKIACVTVGNSSVVAAMAGLRLPVESRPLRALVSEPLKPCLDTVIMSSALRGYISQTDQGNLVIGVGVDGYDCDGPRGCFHVIEHTLQAICELFPAFGRVHMNRRWGGIVDVCPDACPIISKTPVKNLYFNCGWGTGGFKATPGSGFVFADTVANDEPHPLARAFSIDRFHSAALGNITWKGYESCY